ncbi:MAG: NUDIX hydrolase, partial [Acetobacteraceae bacterium]
MKAAELRGRLARLARSEHPGRLIRGNERLAIPVSSPVAAAVLVAFVLTDSPAVLLTKRNERLKRHAGQVSFPGGRADPGDADAVATALREAEEEIALHRR